MIKDRSIVGKKELPLLRDKDGKIFIRRHALDRIAEFAHHPEGLPADDLDIFAAHANSERSKILVGIVITIVVFAVVVGAIALLWKRIADYFGHLISILGT